MAENDVRTIVLLDAVEARPPHAADLEGIHEEERVLENQRRRQDGHAINSSSRIRCRSSSCASWTRTRFVLLNAKRTWQAWPGTCESPLPIKTLERIHTRAYPSRCVGCFGTQWGGTTELLTICTTETEGERTEWYDDSLLLLILVMVVCLRWPSSLVVKDIPSGNNEDRRIVGERGRVRGYVLSPISISPGERTQRYLELSARVLCGLS